MRGERALRAEVVFGVDQSRAEEVLPHAVDGDAGRERDWPDRRATGPGRAASAAWFSCGSGGRNAGTPPVTRRPGRRKSPRISTCDSRGCARSCITSVVGTAPIERHFLRFERIDAGRQRSARPGRSRERRRPARPAGPWSALPAGPGRWRGSNWGPAARRPGRPPCSVAGVRSGNSAPNTRAAG